MKNIGTKSFVLLLGAAIACGVGVPDYHSREHKDGPESHLAKALLANDTKAVGYWIEKAQPSLALCYLLEEQYGDLKDHPATMGMLDFLFERGASPNVICEHYMDKFSPLSLAVSLERPDIVQYLLTHDADPNLHFADKIEGEKIKPMSTLMLAVSRHGVLQKQIDDYPKGISAGYYSADNYEKVNSELENKRRVCNDIVKLLLASNADVNYQGSFDTPIFRASLPENKSALMIAVERFDREMIKLLLKNGARKDLKDAHGKTAEAYAADAGHLDLARELTPE